MPKNPGAASEFSRQRLFALMAEYDRYIASAPYIRMPDLFAHIVDRPCERFWVSEVRAAVVVAAMLRGDPLASMRPVKREMFREIFSRFLVLRESRPRDPISSIVADVVLQPAPKFYLSPSSAKIMVYKARKQWFAVKKLRMRLS